MTSQYILIAGAMLILSQISLNVRSSMLQTKDVSYQNEAILGATAIAQSILREAASKKFDEKSIGARITSPDSLTSVGSLGPDFGESYSTFDDVDDYNGYATTISTGRLGDYSVAVAVHYTVKDSLGAPSGIRSFMKSIDVTVSGNPYLTTDLKMNTIVSY